MTRSTMWKMALAALMVAALLGCGMANGTVGSKGKLAIVVTANTAARTLLPPISMVCASYYVACTASGQTEQDFTVGGNTTVDLAPATWTITVTGKNAQGTAIGQGVGSAAVTLGGETACNVTVTPYAGAGTYALDMRWNNVTNPPGNNWSVTSTIGGTPVSWTVAHDGFYDATASGSMPAGYHTLIAQTFNGVFDPAYPTTTGCVNGWVDVVRIVQGQTTSGSADFLTTGQVIVGIAPDMKDPIAVTVSGLPSSGPVTVGVPLALSATATGATTLPVVYTWYVDGFMIGSSESVSFTPTSSGTNYNIACVVYSADGEQGGASTQWVVAQ